MILRHCQAINDGYDMLDMSIQNTINALEKVP